MEDYYPILIADQNDDIIDYVVLVNNGISPEVFEARVTDAMNKLFEEDYDYDGCYWDAICEKLTDLDFKTFGSINKIYY